MSDVPPDDGRRYAPATLRNRDPILDVLKQVLPDKGALLEVAAGSGEHAVYFARAFPGVAWQPSDPDPANLTSIAAWSKIEGPPNLLPPVRLDVLAPSVPLGRYTAGLCINMIHIAPWAATAALFALFARCLEPGAPAVLYGPFKLGGKQTSPSNAAFDESLRARDPLWGVRDLEAVTETADRAGFSHERTVNMPANNLTVIFRCRMA